MRLPRLIAQRKTSEFLHLGASLKYFEYFRTRPVRERASLLLRFALSVMAVVLMAVSLSSTLLGARLSLFTLSLAHFDVSAGLFALLRSNIHSSSSLSNPSNSKGVGVTTSEILILSRYSTSQIAGSPQFVSSGLWGICVGNYSLIPRVVVQGEYWDIDPGTPSVICNNTNGYYSFDYRHILTDVGLDVVVAYAYPDGADTPEYQATLDSNLHAKHIFVGLSATSCALQLFLVAGTWVCARCKPSRVVLNAIAVTSVISLVLLGVASAYITIFTLELKRRVARELSSFGISIMFGVRWFSCIWVAFGFTVFSVAFWGGPLWCANPKVTGPYRPFGVRDQPFHPGSYVYDTAPDNNSSKDTLPFRESLAPDPNGFTDQVYNGFSQPLPNPFQPSQLSLSVAENNDTQVSLLFNPKVRETVTRRLPPSDPID